MTSKPGTRIGLYVHVPFCPGKCGYCDFYSMVPDGPLVELFLGALLAELDDSLKEEAFQIETIFVGGGTPTFLPVRALERLFDRLGRLAAEHKVIEFTVEANPDSMKADKAEILRNHHVNRVSMGAQSFQNDELARLGRIHRANDIKAGAEVIHRAGFEHFNLDLIFGIPGQTPTCWSDSLRQAINLGPDHLACYGLTYEPGTPMTAELDSGQLTPMDEETETSLYLRGIEQLVAAGFKQYEISNFARAGGRCRHNLRYWHNLSGLGVGPSASSYIHGRRWRNPPDVREYLRRIRAREPLGIDVETLDPKARAGETAMLQLRLTEGIDCESFAATTGFDPCDLFAGPIARHVSDGLLAATSTHIALTPKGRLVADTIIADFLRP